MKIINKKNTKKTILSTILETIDCFITIGKTSTSVTVFFNGYGLSVIPISLVLANRFPLSEKVMHEALKNHSQ